MNFNIYNDSVFRKFSSQFSSITAFVFKTFVVVPCITFFFIFFLLAYSAGGAGNIITEYVKSVDYNAGTDSYRVCIDEPKEPAIPDHPPVKSPAESDARKQKIVDVICQEYGDISADKKASMLTVQITSYYLNIVIFYILALFLIRLFKKPLLSQL